MRLLSSLLLLVVVTPAGAAKASKSPLGEVVELLDSLAAKIMRQGEAEEKSFKAFSEWCGSAATDKKHEIKTATARKEGLEAEISKAASVGQAAGARVEELAGNMAADEADLKSATTVREKEATDYQLNEAELVEVIDTLSRAITVVEREMAKRPAAFAQMDTSSLDNLVKSLTTIVDAASFPSADKDRLVALVQAQQGGAADDEDMGAPAAAVYKSHSGGIVDVLEDLKERAEEQLGDLRKAETNARHNYNMLKQSLEDQTAADAKDMGEQKASRASAAEAKAAAEGDLAVTVKALADAKAALELAQGSCMQSAADHQASVKAREEELKAISDAKKLLQESTAGAEARTYSMLQLDRTQGGSALQTRADLANAEVVTLVKKLARDCHSAALAQLASRIQGVLQYGAGLTADPLAKVRTMIEELISKLEAEAGGEATEKAYCDEQLAKTEEKKGELSHEVSKITAKIDQAAAKSAGLKGDVRELQADLASLAKQTVELDKIRRDEHAAYVQAKAELEQGLEGVRRALGILREYYGSGSDAAAMVQDGSTQGEAQTPEVPGTHSKAEGAGSSITGLLEVVESDFAKSLATSEAEEDDAEVQYQKVTQTNKVTRAMKEQDVKYNTQEFKQLDKEIAELTGDRETTDAELSAVLEYYAKIKERCIAKPMTYEDRRARREAEIKGLKEALSILEDETALVQRRKRGLRGGRAALGLGA